MVGARSKSSLIKHTKLVMTTNEKQKHKTSIKFSLNKCKCKKLKIVLSNRPTNQIYLKVILIQNQLICQLSCIRYLAAAEK